MTLDEAYRAGYQAALLTMPEIVRCKDCKHRLECDYWIENGDDWFCADGEMKDEDIRKLETK